MPLTIEDCSPRTIVDHESEIVKVGRSMEERPRSDVRRGIVVANHPDDDLSNSGSVSEVYVYFGAEAAKEFMARKVPVKNITINGKTVKAVKVAPAELHRVYSAGTTPSNRAWGKIFGEPERIGGIRRKSGGMRKSAAVVSDELDVTPETVKGPIEDNRGGDEGIDRE